MKSKCKFVIPELECQTFRFRNSFFLKNPSHKGQTGKKEPGTLQKFRLEEFERTLHHTSPHDISLFQAFRIMKEHNEKLPHQVIIYGIEVEDTQTFSEKCTEKVNQAIPGIVETIIKEQNLH